jgi:hypothetical protein
MIDSSPKVAEPGAPCPGLERPATLVVGLRNWLRHLHLPSCLVFRDGIPHLLIEQVPALVRVTPLGFLCHLPRSPGLPHDQSMVIAQPPMEEAAVQISTLVNAELVGQLKRRARDPYRLSQLHHGLRSVRSPDDCERDGTTAVRARSELMEAAHALRCGKLSIDDLEPAEDTPPAELGSAAYMAAYRLRCLIFSGGGQMHIMPVNPWVAMALVERGPSVLTDGTFVCWVSPRRSVTGRDLVSFATGLPAAAARLLQISAGVSPGHQTPPPS